MEGTNEINRLVTIDTLNKRGAKKDYDLYGQGNAIVDGLASLEGCSCCVDGYYENKKAAIVNFKNTAKMLLTAVSNTFGRTMMNEQMILNNISNIVMRVYVCESVLLRVQKKEEIHGLDVTLNKDMLDCLVYDSAEYIRKEAKDCINSFVEDEEQHKLFSNGIKYYTCTKGVNVKAARTRIADKLIEENKYCF